MYYVYDGEEFKHVLHARGDLIINHDLLKMYKPSVNLTNIKELGITEDMVLSYVYHNLKDVEEIPLHYPLRITLNSINGKLVIKDSCTHNNFMMFVSPEKIKKTQIVNKLYLGLPIKLLVLDSFMTGSYRQVLELNIPQINDMISGLIRLNSVITVVEEVNCESEVEDLVDILKKLTK